MQGMSSCADSRTIAGRRHIPVVMVSADATARQAGRLLQLGASAYLTKPFDFSELLQAVDEALSEEGGT